MQTLEDSAQRSSSLINDKSQPHESSEAIQQNHAITEDLLSQAERLRIHIPEQYRPGVRRELAVCKAQEGRTQACYGFGVDEFGRESICK